MGLWPPGAGVCVPLPHGTQGRGRTQRGGLGGAPTGAGSWALWPSAPPPKEFCVPSKLLRNWQGHHTYQNDTD